jgi:PEP-CTERM motif
MVMQVPEPATALLVLGGAIALMQGRRFMRAR